jgi:H+/Cl- antiporter ClcA
MSRSLKSVLGRERPNRFADNLTEHFRTARHVFLIAAPFGVIVGAAIAGYDYVVNEFLWKSCTEHLSPLMLCFSPIAAMVLTGAIMSLFRVKSSSMADEVVRAYHRPDQEIDYKAALPKLAASVATMGFGASAGMEGASKWLGGTITSYLQRKINRNPRLQFLRAKAEIMLMVGAAAGIAAIFRAPLTGAIMGIESPYKHDLAHEALIPGLVASATSYARPHLIFQLISCTTFTCVICCFACRWGFLVDWPPTSFSHSWQERRNAIPPRGWLHPMCKSNHFAKYFFKVDDRPISSRSRPVVGVNFIP